MEAGAPRRGCFHRRIAFLSIELLGAMCSLPWPRRHGGCGFPGRPSPARHGGTAAPVGARALAGAAPPPRAPRAWAVSACALAGPTPPRRGVDARLEPRLWRALRASLCRGPQAPTLSAGVARGPSRSAAEQKTKRDWPASSSISTRAGIRANTMDRRPSPSLGRPRAGGRNERLDRCRSEAVLGWIRGRSEIGPAFALRSLWGPYGGRAGSDLGSQAHPRGAVLNVRASHAVPEQRTSTSSRARTSHARAVHTAHPLAARRSPDKARAGRAVRPAAARPSLARCALRPRARAEMVLVRRRRVALVPPPRERLERRELCRARLPQRRFSN